MASFWFDHSLLHRLKKHFFTHLAHIFKMDTSRQKTDMTLQFFIIMLIYKCRYCPLDFKICPPFSKLIDVTCFTALNLRNYLTTGMCFMFRCLPVFNFLIKLFEGFLGIFFLYRIYGARNWSDRKRTVIRIINFCL